MGQALRLLHDLVPCVPHLLDEEGIVHVLREEEEEPQKSVGSRSL